MEETAQLKPLFTRESLVRLIIPLVVEQFLLMSVGMMDTVMVTSAGQAAVSGVSLVDNMNLLIIMIFSALSSGGAVICSQYLGRQEVEYARTAAKQLLYVVFSLATVLMVLALVFNVTSISVASLLNAMEKYIAAQLTGFPLSVCVIAASVFFSDTYGIEAVAWGVFAANVLQLLVLIPFMRGWFKY